MNARWASLAAATAMLPGPAPAQTFNSDSVLALHRAGLSKAAIVAKIKASPCDYDTGTDRLIALKQAGLDEDVIVAMVEKCAGATHAAGSDAGAADPLVRHEPGIYLADMSHGALRLQILRPTAMAGEKITGNGSLLFPRLAKGTVPQPAAQHVASGDHPRFYFYFNPGNANVDSFGSFATHAAQSPNEFALVHFRVVGANRQFLIGRAQPYITTEAVDPKTTLPFSISDLDRGIYRVDLTEALPPGEYGFVLAGEKGSFRIYDFAVGGPTAAR